MQYNDITHETGSVNISGIGDAVYFIAKRHIAKWPPITDDVMAALMADRHVEYGEGEDIEIKTADGWPWTMLYNTQGKGKVEWDMQGETDCKVVVNKATMTYPRITNASRAFAKQAANGDFVFCIRHDGKYYIIGHKDYRATLTTVGDSGDAAGSAKGLTIEIACSDTTPLPTYVGHILTEEDYIDCKTNTILKINDMSTNLTKRYEVEGGRTVRFSALSQQGRMLLVGDGDITVEVSVDGEAYTEVAHGVAFSKGLATVPVQFIIGDCVRISAEHLEACTVNWNNVNLAERS